MPPLKQAFHMGILSLFAAFFISPASAHAVDVDSSRFIGDSAYRAEPDAQSGAFTQNYAFTLPPGRNGMEPSLSLSYSSMQGDNASIAGYGWSLSIPSITRLAPHGVDELYTRHDFSSSLSGELSDISLSDGMHGTYGAKVDDGSHLSYTYNTDETWTVRDKRGITYTFGGDAYARVDNPSDSTQVFRWMLTKTEDTLGNAVTYTYATDGNQVYPNAINYTGFGTTEGIFDVDFVIEARGDVFTSYATGFAVTTSYRMSEIIVSIDNHEVRSYEFGYGTGDNGMRSMLTSITETGTTEDGTSSLTNPVTTFSYQEGNESWSATSVTFPEIIAGTSGSLGVYLFDMNGDAITDIVKSRPGSQEISVGNGDGTWSSSAVTPPLEFSLSSGADKGVRIMDVNGDGLLDVVYARSLSGVLDEAVYINAGNGTGWVEDTAWTVPIPFTTETGSGLGVEIFDVDGDGLPDIVQSRDGFAPEVYINDGDGTGWTLDAGYVVPVYFVGSSGLDQGVRAIDVNGDSLIDLVRSQSSTTAVYINAGNGTGWTEDATWTVPLEFTTASGTDKGVRPLDVNGDGLVDLVYHRTDGSAEDQEIYLNTGMSWSSTSLTTPLAFNLTSGADLGVRAEDIDGDGLVDMLRSRLVGTTAYNDLYLAAGEVADLMTAVTTTSGASSEITYKSSVNGENPNLPFVVQATQEISVYDGLGNVSTKTYNYADGDYFYDDAFNRGFAGFGEVTTTNALGKTVSYFSQGNDADIAMGESADGEAYMGRVYRTEYMDLSDHTYKTIIDTWEAENIGTNRDFMLKLQTLELLYGSATTHVDRATSYVYDSSGNLEELIAWGEGVGADDGSFSDSGTDKRITKWEYALFASSGEASAYKILERLSGYTGTQTRLTKWTYDSLAPGFVESGLVTGERRYVSMATAYDTTFAYDSYGMLASTTDPAGYTTSFTPDAYNLYPETTTNALLQSTSYVYDYSSGAVRGVADANGIVTTTTYDALDRATDVAVTAGANTETLTEYTYDTTSLPYETHQTDWFNESIARETYTYMDGLGREVQTRTEAEGVSTFSVIDTMYDEVGNVVSVSLPYENSGAGYALPTTTTNLLTTTTYDALGRPLSIENATGTATVSYNGRAETTIDVNGNIVVRMIDALGRLMSVEESEGSSAFTTSYSYNAADELVALRDPAGNVRSFTYDQRGARLTATDLHAPTDAQYGTWRFAYDARNLLASKMSPDNITVNYTYDELGRATTENMPTSGGIDIVYAYDSCTNGVGRLCTATVQGGSITEYDYDAFGNISDEDRLILGAHYITSYDYDLQGGIAEVIYPDASRATNILDASGLLDEVDFIDGRTSTTTVAVSDIMYGPHGKPTEITYGNGAVTTYTYDATELYRLSGIETISGSTTLQDFAYTYDNVGNIITLDDASGLYADMSIDYSYNSRNLLTDAIASSTDTVLTYTKAWTYSNIGNIASSTDCGTYSYNGIAFGNYANPHAPTSTCGKTYAYNKSGNLTSDGTYTYQENALGLLGKVKSGGATITSFGYDESGNRVSKVSTAHGTTITPNGYYTVDGSSYERNILAGDLGSVATSTYSGSSASLIYHHKDHLGGTHVESDASGASVEYILYTPFGATLVDQKTGSYDNDHKYTNKEQDEDSGFYYYGARYYNPEVGVFVAQDPVYLRLGTESLAVLQDPQQLNSYSYTRNNPIRFIDPLGESVKVYMEEGNASRDGFKSYFGHTFLDVNGVVYSWSPSDQGNWSLTTAPTSSFLSTEGKNADNFTVYTFDTTQAQDQNVVDYYTSLRENFLSWQGDSATNPYIFDLFSNNCTDVAVGALQSGGILTNDFDLPGISTPGKLQDRLDQKYRSQGDDIFNKISGWLHRGENSKVADISSREKVETQ